MTRIAVVGSGIAGLAAARSLSARARVTLFEAGDHFGGHANTVEVEIGGRSGGVDTGFLVFNERTYPRLVRLFVELGVETAKSDMSFSVQAPKARVEWSGSDLGGVFAQRSNLLRPRFLAMLAEIARFNRVAAALVRANTTDAADFVDESLGDFLARHRFSREFRDWYFLPMTGCIWSCPTARMLDFPLATMLRFCDNHGLLQIADRPQWLTVRGGSRRYVERMVAAVGDARLRAPVRSVRRLAERGAVVASDAGHERFDAVVMACHSDQALSLLADSRPDERAILGAITYHRSRAVLHTDTTVLPQRRRAWAAWNYERAADPATERVGVCLHYLIDRLQPLPFDRPVIVSMNPIRLPDPARVLGEFDYDHPVFDRAAIAAQSRLPSIQGRLDTWFCGAWAGHGFHEDGLASALDVCAQLAGQADKHASATERQVPVA